MRRAGFFRLLTASVFCAVLFALPPSARSIDASSLTPPAHYARISERVAAFLPREHLTHHAMDDVISRRAWTNYVTSLDFNRVFFLQSDIDAFAVQLDKLDDSLKDGDLTFAYHVYDVFRQRVDNRCRYVKELLKKGFTLTVKESVRWKRTEAPWPADETEWNEIWRKRIKNEYLRRIIAREEADAAVRKSDAAPEKKEPVPPQESAENPPDDDDPAANPSLTPEQFIEKQYDQFFSSIFDVDAEWVLQKYLSSFARAYDPHSDYMSPSAAEDFEIEMKLSLVGIGALLRPEDGAARIVRVIPGGPAASDKRDIRLLPGDKIIAVGQDEEPPVNVLHWPLNKTVRLIRGKKGTRVVLVVIPASDPSGTAAKTVDLVRDDVRLEEQAAKLRIIPVKNGDKQPFRFGVITVPGFYANMKARSEKDSDFRSASFDVEKLIEEAKSNRVDGLLLDIRSNGGGALPEAVAMTGLFISTGPTVMVRERFGVKIVSDRDPAIAYAGPLFVLVNRASASASEILAAALQDHGRAIVLGDSRTHGKGTVQTVVPVGFDPKLGKMKITSWVYHRINGLSVQLKGVTPDIVIPSPLEYMDIGEDELPNAIMEWEPVAPADYMPLADFRADVARMKELLRKDETSNPRLISYMELLAKIKDLNSREEWPLNIDERRSLAQMEKELADLQKRLLPDVLEPPEQNVGADIVLDESLKLLADFVIHQEKYPPPGPDPVSQEKTGFFEAVRDWLRDLI